ncbi:MAG: hypothetical protein CBC12_03040 [Candidatus Puniceispirillum sp. TMED52]|nr:DUF2256 domain-containing protein [SAR116 cluster bacterium]OUU53051.1 MAG: hypothetical protein CBC12_03040 [Candidatus Puniceispirillum sp. TMED52]
MEVSCRVCEKKTELPSKICPVCGLGFVWRKKWQKVWDDVIYCSEKCRRNSRSQVKSDNRQSD